MLLCDCCFNRCVSVSELLIQGDVHVRRLAMVLNFSATRCMCKRRPGHSPSAMYHVRSAFAFLGNSPVVHALHLSSVDLTIATLYCLPRVPKCSLRPLQLALNMAARLVFKTRRSCHVSPLLDQLKWLLIKKRIEEKILTLVFKARNGLCPLVPS